MSDDDGIGGSYSERSLKSFLFLEEERVLGMVFFLGLFYVEIFCVSVYVIVYLWFSRFFRVLSVFFFSSCVRYKGCRNETIDRSFM